MQISKSGMGRIMSKENEKIIAVEWRNKKPFTVFTKNHCYDIEFDKSGQGYYNCSGSGGMQGNNFNKK